VTRRFVLLDRDGTINEEIGYVLEPRELRLLPGVGAALGELRGLGLGLVVVSNQSPIGRGLLSWTGLEAIHARLTTLLAAERVELDGIYVCPHRPGEGCGCRKPAPGLALRAAEAHGFDPGESFVVGDHATDVGLGRALGATSILVRTGHGQDELEGGGAEGADAVVADLPEAAVVIAGRVLSGAGR
jgi:D-glycero-D-manno-heptose 1,7-bisphosphate phosphatase